MSNKQETAFVKISRLIPNEEELTSRNFLLYNNDLHFEGDRSWFIIHDFVKSEFNYKLSYGDIQCMFRMDTDVELKRSNDNEITITNGSGTIQIGLRPTDIVPRTKTMIDTFKIPDTFVIGRKIGALTDEFSSMFADKIDDMNCFVLHRQDMMGIVIGDDEFSGSVTTEIGSILAAILVKAEIGTDKNKSIYFKINEPVQIDAMVKCTKQVISDQAYESTRKIIGMVTEPDSWVFKAKFGDLLKASKMVTGLKSNNLVDYIVTKDKMKVFTRNYANTRITMEMDIENISCPDISFENIIVSQNVLNFLTASIAKPTESMITFVLNGKNKRIIMHPDTERVQTLICTYLKVNNANVKTDS